MAPKSVFQSVAPVDLSVSSHQHASRSTSLRISITSRRLRELRSSLRVSHNKTLSSSAGFKLTEFSLSERNSDGKSFKNPTPTTKSKAYTSFPSPITNDIRGGFDIHIYYTHTDAFQFKFAKELWERIFTQRTSFTCCPKGFVKGTRVGALRPLTTG